MHIYIYISVYSFKLLKKAIKRHKAHFVCDLQRMDTDHGCPTHETLLCHTRHARLYNMFPPRADASERVEAQTPSSPALAMF